MDGAVFYDLLRAAAGTGRHFFALLDNGLFLRDYNKVRRKFPAQESSASLRLKDYQKNHKEN